MSDLYDSEGCYYFETDTQPCDIPGCNGDHSRVEDWGLGGPLVVHQIVDDAMMDFMDPGGVNTQLSVDTPTTT